MYKNYIFDLYGTLIDLYTDEEKNELWENLALFYSYNGSKYSKDELKKRYMDYTKDEIEKNSKTEYPDIEIKNVFKRLYKTTVNEELIEYTAKVFRLLSTDSIKLYAGIKEMLKELKKQGKNVYLLSNGQRSFSIPELKYFEIYKYFDGIYFSADIGICKPDEIFYKYLIENEKIKISESIMIGNDHTSDIEGANRIGMDSLYIYSNHSKKTNFKFNAKYKIKNGDFKKMCNTLLKG